MDMNAICGRHALAFASRFDYIREAGTDGEARAAETIREAVRALGACPETEPFTVPVRTVDEAAFEMTAPFVQSYPVGATLGTACTPKEGLSAPFFYAENGDDISLTHAAGKIVLLNGPVRPPLAEKLAEAGALAFLTVTGTPLDEGEDRVPGNNRFYSPKTAPLPGGVLHMRDAAEMVERAAESGGTGNDAPAAARFTLRWHEGEGESANIICRVPGTSPETLTVTAHYDSVPAGPGAYDNMAACAIVYELLGYFLKHPVKRSLEFIFLGAEEKGLLGSRAYVKRHEAELSNHRFNMNIDLAGQTVGGTVFGVTAGHEVDECLLAIARETGLGATVKNQVWASDSNAFAACGIPAMTLNRDGFGMHTRHDTFDLLSVWSLERSARLLGAIVEKLGSAETFPFERKVPEEYLEQLNRRL